MTTLSLIRFLCFLIAIVSIPARADLPRDPSPPYSKVSKAGHDPFSESVEYFDSGDGIFYNWTRANVDVEEASTILSSDAPLGTIIPGRVIKDGKPLTYMRVGNSPFLLVCIHTDSTPWTKYMRNWAPSRRMCDTGSCRDDVVARNMQAITDEQWGNLSQSELHEIFLDGAKKVAMPIGDSSGSACEGIYDYIVNKTKGAMYPHLVYSGVPKAFNDNNRNPRYFIFPRGWLKTKYNLEAQSPEIIASRDDFFGFVREAKNVIARSYGYGWIFNMHSQASVGNRCDVGTGWEKPLAQTFKHPDVSLRAVQPFTVPKPSSDILLMFDSLNRGMTPYEAIFGNTSVSEILSLRGLGSAPSRAHQFSKKGEDCFCSGSAFTNRVGMPSLTWAKGRKQLINNKEITNRPVESWYVGNFNNAIVELYTATTNTSTELGKQTIQVWGETLIDIAVDHYKLDIARPTGRVFKSLDTTYKAIMGGVSCKAKKANMLKKYQLEEQRDSITVEKCVSMCNELAGCRYIEMSVDPQAKRYCSFYTECKSLPVTRYRNVVDVALYNAGD